MAPFHRTLKTTYPKNFGERDFRWKCPRPIIYILKGFCHHTVTFLDDVSDVFSASTAKAGPRSFVAFLERHASHSEFRNWASQRRPRRRRRRRRHPSRRRSCDARLRSRASSNTWPISPWRFRPTLTRPKRASAMAVTMMMNILSRWSIKGISMRWRTKYYVINLNVKPLFSLTHKSKPF